MIFRGVLSVRDGDGEDNKIRFLFFGVCGVIYEGGRALGRLRWKLGISILGTFSELAWKEYFI